MVQVQGGFGVEKPLTSHFGFAFQAAENGRAGWCVCVWACDAEGVAGDAEVESQATAFAKSRTNKPNNSKPASPEEKNNIQKKNNCKNYASICCCLFKWKLCYDNDLAALPEAV